MREERHWMHLLAQFEEQVTQFESAERPSYEEWLRLELGTKIRPDRRALPKDEERRLCPHQELTESMNTPARSPLPPARGKDPTEDDSQWQEKCQANEKASAAAKKQRRRQTARQINPACRAPRERLNSLPKLARKFHPTPFMSNLPKERALTRG